MTFIINHDLNCNSSHLNLYQLGKTNSQFRFLAATKQLYKRLLRPSVRLSVCPSVRLLHLVSGR